MNAFRSEVTLGQALMSGWFPWWPRRSSSSLRCQWLYMYGRHWIGLYGLMAIPVGLSLLPLDEFANRYANPWIPLALECVCCYEGHLLGKPIRVMSSTCMGYSDGCPRIRIDCWVGLRARRSVLRNGEPRSMSLLAKRSAVHVLQEAKRLYSAGWKKRADISTVFDGMLD